MGASYPTKVVLASISDLTEELLNMIEDVGVGINVNRGSGRIHATVGIKIKWHTKGIKYD